jgi:L-ascorbate metabolism protein UlaG (beta-lactamase superfamily)
LATTLARALALAALLAGCGAPRYHGPVSPHFDGDEFSNLAPFEERNFFDFLAWQIGTDAVPWPDWVDLPPRPPPPERVGEGAEITFVNHATVLIQLPGANVLSDPIWSDRIGSNLVGPLRHKPPGIAFDDLPPIDAVIISHNHFDHLDVPTLVRLKERDNPVVVAGLGTGALLRENGIFNAIDLDWWQSTDVGAATITFAPAQHWSARGLDDRHGNLWGSFYLQAGASRVYFAGDTAAGPHFAMIRKRLGRPAVALLPIGAYSPRWFMRPQHMDPAEAVAAHLALGAKKSIGIHWGTFALTDEGMDDPPRALRRALRARRVPEGRFLVLDNGESCAAPCLW